MELPTAEPQSLLVRLRDDAEEVLDLFELFNAPAARARVLSPLPAPLHALGPLRLSYVSWERADLRPLAPARHAERELLATVNVEFHAALPAALDVDGTLVFYLGFWLDGAGALRGSVEGATFHFRGGLAAAAKAITQALEGASRGGLPVVQEMLEAALSGFTRGRRFRHLDLLPGRGGRSGRRRWGNADRQIVLAAVPA